MLIPYNPTEKKFSVTHISDLKIYSVTPDFQCDFQCHILVVTNALSFELLFVRSLGVLFVLSQTWQMRYASDAYLFKC